MTLRDLLNTISEEKPNSFSEAKLISFVNEIEAEVAEEINETDVPVYKHEHDDELDKVLLAPAPYDRLYVSYVKARIDFINEEFDAYANDQAQHVQDFRDFVDWVSRTGRGRKADAVRRFRNILY